MKYIDPVARTYQYMNERSRARVEAFEPREPRFNPSSISKCARQLGYKHLGTPPEFEEDSGWLSQYGPSGDFYHDHVRFEMRDAGVEFAGLTFDDHTRRVEENDACKPTISHNGVDGIILSGRGDGRIKLGDTWAYNELKTVGEGKYRWMLKSYHDGGSAKLLKYLREKYTSYMEQINMMCSPEMLDLPCTYLVLVNRGNCQFGVCDRNFKNRTGGLVIPFDPELWEKQKNKMAMIQRMTNDGELPIRGRSEGSKDCSQCPYERRCWL
jgi:hypothetical protein